MTTKTEPDDPVIIAQLEEYGAAQVQIMIMSGQFPPQLNRTAMLWLKRKDHESRALNEASQASQIRIALSAERAAWIAAKAAIITAVLAIISIIIMWFMWFDPHE